MHSVIELENRWRAYRRKRVFKALGVALGILLLSVGLVYVYGQYSLSHSMQPIQANNINEQLTPTLQTQQAANEQQNVQQNMQATNPTQTQMQTQVQNIPTPSPLIAYKPDVLKVSSSADETIESVKARYEANQNYNDALFLAKAYYENKEYEKVEFWALEANKLDSSQEDSWILFAKTKFILGEEGDALRALEAYLEKEDSPELQKLLQKMEESLVH